MKIQRLKIRLLGIILVALGTSCTEQNAISYTDYVNVFIGTGGHGHTFPGATYPHGMVQLIPACRVGMLVQVIIMMIIIYMALRILI